MLKVEENSKKSQIDGGILDFSRCLGAVWTTDEMASFVEVVGGAGGGPQGLQLSS